MPSYLVSEDPDSKLRVTGDCDSAVLIFMKRNFDAADLHHFTGGLRLTDRTQINEEYLLCTVFEAISPDCTSQIQSCACVTRPAGRDFF